MKHYYVYLRRACGQALPILVLSLCLVAVSTQAQIVPAGPTGDGGGPLTNQLPVAGLVADTSWHGKPIDWSSTAWTRTEAVTNSAGGFTNQVRQYIEVGDGLNFISLDGSALSGSWQRSADEIDLMTTNEIGGAAALRGPTKVYFSPTVGADGPTLRLTTCSNVVLQIQPTAIYYTDDSGTNVLLANIRPDAEGELLPPNRIVYHSVTTNGLSSDLVFSYAHGAFESHLLILSQPSETPDMLGLDPSTAKISLVHLVNGPLPLQTPIITTGGLGDVRLDFSGLSFPQGFAFLTADSSGTNSPSLGTPAQIQRPGGGSEGIPVTKSIIPIGPQLC